jgi:ERCC4-type nuclease
VSECVLLVDVKEPMDMQMEIGANINVYQMAELPTGDFSNSKKLFLAERKDADDFYSSLMDGRYESQRWRMSLFPRARFWIIEGQFWALYNQSPPNVKQRFDNAIASLTTKFSINVIYTSSMGHTARFIVALHQKSLGLPLPPQVSNQARQNPHLQQAQCILMGIEGVGEKLSERILREFKSIENFNLASKRELIERVNGIGPKLAETIYTAFHNEVKFDEKTKN